MCLAELPLVFAHNILCFVLVVVDRRDVSIWGAPERKMAHPTPYLPEGVLEKLGEITIAGKSKYCKQPPLTLTLGVVLIVSR